jgi:glycosyltransferase involved in cell wall biosynthesis
MTVQALRLYHNLDNCEILVVDNYGDPDIEKFIKSQGAGVVRYEKYTERVGPANAKDRVFELARGEMVVCIDSHVLLAPGSLDNIPITDDLIYGTFVYNDLKNYCCEWKPVWRGSMWGTWGDCVQKQNIPKEPFEIWGCGGGCFCARKSSWLGFNKRFKGFGGEEGYLSCKYRKAGRKVICLPSLQWVHKFERKRVPYPLKQVDRVFNYLVGFEELGMDPQPMIDHFGLPIVEEAKKLIALEKPVSIKKKISCLCLAYGRPRLLEEAVESFLRQDYPNKELIIVNDLADQELVYEHPQIKIFNFKERLPTHGEKRNKSVELSSGEILTSWDDDDISLPWRLTQIAKAWDENPDLGYFKPEKAWCDYGERIARPHANMFFMQAAFSRKAFDAVGGYAKINKGEDTDFCSRLMSFLPPQNVLTKTFPDNEYAFIYGWKGDSIHLSAMGGETDMLINAEKYIKSKPIEPVVHLKPHWIKDYLGITREILLKEKKSCIQANSKNLVFTGAKYGADTRFSDVLDLIVNAKKRSGDDNMILCIDNHNMKGDPAPGVLKTLKLSYTLDGAPFSMEINENEDLIAIYD